MTEEMRGIVLLFIVVFFLFAGLSGYRAFRFRRETIGSLSYYLRNDFDIIYLGDSTVGFYSDMDLDKRNIAEMLQSKLPLYKIGRVSQPAYHLEVYYEFSKYILKQPKLPEMVIIPVNMRSFSPEWDVYPGYEFKREQLLLRGDWRYFFNFVSISNPSFSKKTDSKFDNLPVYRGTKKVGIMKEYFYPGITTMKKKALLSYMYILRENHRKLKALINTGKILSSNGITPVFYITPVDYEKGESFYPIEFKAILKANIKIIEELCMDNKVNIVNFGFELGTSYFYYENFMNEHLNEKGREKLAEMLSDTCCLRAK